MLSIVVEILRSTPICSFQSRVAARLFFLISALDGCFSLLSSPFSPRRARPPTPPPPRPRVNACAEKRTDNKYYLHTYRWRVFAFTLTPQWLHASGVLMSERCRQRHERARLPKEFRVFLPWSLPPRHATPRRPERLAQSATLERTCNQARTYKQTNEQTQSQSNTTRRRDVHPRMNPLLLERGVALSWVLLFVFSSRPPSRASNIAPKVASVSTRCVSV